jgi:hypothetical protein
VECNLNVPKAASPLHMTFLPKVGVVRVGRVRSSDHMSRIPSNCRAANVSQGLARDYHSPRDNHINSIYRRHRQGMQAIMHAAVPGISILTIFLNFMFGTRLYLINYLYGI